jgi:hypothetical protein
VTSANPESGFFATKGRVSGYDPSVDIPSEQPMHAESSATEHPLDVAVDADFSAAQRARHQAVELAERMLRDVMGASGDPIAGLTVWQEAVMLRAIAEEERAFADEEARRLLATATAKRDELRAGYEIERRQARADLQHEMQASRDAAAAEVADLQSSARAEADEIVRRAVATADEAQRVANAEAQRLERRLAVLHSALADAEGRFRRLAATAANEVGTMQAIIDEDLARFTAAEPAPPPPPPPPAPPRPELYLAAVDLTNEALARDEQDVPAVEGDTTATEPRTINRDPDVGFYQRRLAGLRDRLEKSGHPPE